MEPIYKQSIELGRFTVTPIDQPVGYYHLADTQFRISTFTKPSWLTRWAMRFVFNIVWKGNE